MVYFYFNNSEIRLNFQYFKGLLCAKKFEFLANYMDLMGSNTAIALEPEKMFDFYNYINKSIVASKINIYFAIDDCKIGEIFNGTD